MQRGEYKADYDITSLPGIAGALPIAIAVAPNGGKRTRADHVALPITAKELAVTASECLEAGACMIHLHVRDRLGQHLLDSQAYAGAIAAVRDAVGSRLVVQITSESVGIYTPAEQMAVIRQVRPEAVSLALRELAPHERDEYAFAGFLEWLRSERIAPQIILYSPDEALRLAALYSRGLISFDRLAVLYVLGRHTPGQRSSPADLLPFIAGSMPKFPHWSTCAFGPREAACVTAAALLGGHMRVGFENNLWRADGRLASSNAELVSTVRAAVTGLGMSIAIADELRRDWGIER